ncbi:uncharacterized protein LOC141530717 isoform X1 [Cotesia typhae]|uniref:uncharacterized protein LOC141530717 isoform X1 n=1 Tax=Cotesia typhae TaxID=2053667 RepID=UPI003D683DEB
MNYFLSLSTISLLIITGEAIRCYECNYCTDLSKSEKIVKDCPDTPKGAACIIVSYVLSNYTWGVRGRGCSSKSLVTDERAASKSVDMGNDTAKVYIQQLSMFYCDFDLCNGSSLFFQQFYTVLLVLFINLVYNIYYNSII